MRISEATSLLLNLPGEIHDEIFLRVPAESILSARCVCKFFCNLLSKPNFIKNHLNRTKINNNPQILFHSRTQNPIIYSIPIDYASISSSSALSCEFDVAVPENYPFKPKNLYILTDQIINSRIAGIFASGFIGSCNGLLCLDIIRYHGAGDDRCTRYYSILNPLTGEYKDIIGTPRHYVHSVYGFGYDINIDDYKLVTLSEFKKAGGLKIDVYTMKSDSWTCIQGPVVNYSFPPPSDDGFRGVFFNGCLHWLGNIDPWEIASLIFSYNVSNETVVDMPLPDNIMPPVDYRGKMYTNVGVCGDFICVAFIWRSVKMDVWVMQEYGVKESWIKKYTTTTSQLRGPLLPYSKLLWCFDNGEILVDNNSKQLHLYDPTNGRVRSVVVPDFTMDFNRVSYVESIVSLGSGTYLKKGITYEKREESRVSTFKVKMILFVKAILKYIGEGVRMRLSEQWGRFV